MRTVYDKRKQVNRGQQRVSEAIQRLGAGRSRDRCDTSVTRRPPTRNVGGVFRYPEHRLTWVFSCRADRI